MLLLLVGLGIPATVTTTLPLVARDGTSARILPSVQLAIAVAPVPLKLTVLVPWDDPNPEPIMVTELPIAPELGLRLVICGPVTVKGMELLAAPPTVTITGPLPSAVPAATSATMLVSLQVEMLVAFVPLKVTLLEPCVAPKFEPEIVTAVPPVPEVGLRVLIFGVAAVKITPLAPEFERGVPSGVEMLTGICAVPDALPATLTTTLNIGVPMARPGTETELVQVMICPESLQVQLPEGIES